MKREAKSAVIDELAEDLGAAEAIFAVDYKGISVPQAAELRSRLRESDAQFKVVKNRLAKLAAAKAGTENIDDLLQGPIALTLIKGDAVVAAKTITTFTREHEILEYRGGIMDGAPLDVDSFQAIARLPGRDVLHGQLVGLVASPLTGLVAGMSNLISGLGRQLAQIAEQGLVTGEAPAAEAPEPDPPVEEPAPDEAPVEEPPADEPAPEPEAEAAEAPSAESGPEAEAEAEAEAESASEPVEGSDPSDETKPETQED
ncbi:MAG: 50S ribosomal protein L10 [Actinomycetota bacterium]|nr:50S ribosomal protein L10 [Actinomycetota bacterium]